MQFENAMMNYRLGVKGREIFAVRIIGVFENEGWLGLGALRRLQMGWGVFRHFRRMGYRFGGCYGDGRVGDGLARRNRARRRAP